MRVPIRLKSKSSFAYKLILNKYNGKPKTKKGKKGETNATSTMVSNTFDALSSLNNVDEGLVPNQILHHW